MMCLYRMDAEVLDVVRDEMCKYELVVTGRPLGPILIMSGFIIIAPETQYSNNSLKYRPGMGNFIACFFTIILT